MFHETLRTSFRDNPCNDAYTVTAGGTTNNTRNSLIKESAHFPGGKVFKEQSRNVHLDVQGSCSPYVHEEKRIQTASLSNCSVNMVKNNEHNNYDNQGTDNANTGFQPDIQAYGKNNKNKTKDIGDYILYFHSNLSKPFNYIPPLLLVAALLFSPMSLMWFKGPWNPVLWLQNILVNENVSDMAFMVIALMHIWFLFAASLFLFGWNEKVAEIRCAVIFLSAVVITWWPIVLLLVVKKWGILYQFWIWWLIISVAFWYIIYLLKYELFDDTFMD